MIKTHRFLIRWVLTIPPLALYFAICDLEVYVNSKLTDLIPFYSEAYAADFYREFYKQIQPLLPVNNPRLNLVNSLILESNQRKLLHVVPLNLNINRYSGLNTHFPSYKSSIILTLTI